MDKHRKQIASPKLRYCPPEKSIWEHYIARSRKGAETRGLTFEIDADYIERLFLRQKMKCAISGLPLDAGKPIHRPTASLDRIESHRGYVAGNVQWVHKAINQMKMDFDEAYFVALCVQVASHRGRGVELTSADRRFLEGQKQISGEVRVATQTMNKFAVTKKTKPEPTISVGGMLL